MTRGTDGPFPNLFVIGAMKAATTSLHVHLDRHPQVFMSRHKEPSFFVPSSWAEGPDNRSDFHSQGRDAYLALFDAAQGARWAGESSTNYTKHGQFDSPAAQIHAFRPQARLIYIVRDPVERAISQYWHEAREFGERRPMLDAFRGSEHYVSISDYAMQLDRYLQHYPLEQLRVVVFEELIRNPAPVVEGLLEWLGVPHPFIPPAGRKEGRDGKGGLHLNAGSGQLYVPRFQPWRTPAPVGLRGTRALRQEPRTLGDRARRVLYRARFREAPQSHEHAAEARAYLADALRPSTARLESLLGRTFPEWVTSAAYRCTAPQ